MGNTNFEIRNLVNWVDGKFGKAVKIDESTSTTCVNQNAGIYTSNIPETIRNLPQGAFTQVWWNYLPQNVGSSRVHMASVAVPKCGTCSIWNQLNYIVVRTTAGGNSDISYTPPSTGTWHQMAYVFDRSNLKHNLYIDGTPIGGDRTLVNGDYGTVQWLAVGVYTPGCVDAIPGAVYDEYSIYNRALSESEIKQLHSGLVSPGQTATIKPLISLSKGTHTYACAHQACAVPQF
ncbi:MAG: LamG domain-containing protein [Candidatus Aenigmarchaeota archaeon]|nr:LamG domain-containing protein [Candidatus Aenigmarchaeota archaeon]